MRFITVYFLITFSLNAVGQFYAKKDHLEYGFNIGTYIAHDSTGVLYNVQDHVANSLHSIFGLNNFINPNSTYQGAINYLNAKYTTGNWLIDNSTIPVNMSYRPGFMIGIHLGKHHPKFKYYLDYNIAEIKVIGQSTIIDANPQASSNNYIGPTRISISGKERRNLFNLGLVLDFINEEDFHLGIPFEVQINQVTLVSNEVYVDGAGQSFSVNHVPANLTNTTRNNNPSGFGFGGGSGLILTLDMAENIMISFGYQGYFAQSNFSANLNPWGLQHTAFARMIWMKE